MLYCRQMNVLSPPPECASLRLTSWLIRKIITLLLCMTSFQNMGQAFTLEFVLAQLASKRVYHLSTPCGKCCLCLIVTPLRVTPKKECAMFTKASHNLALCEYWLRAETWLHAGEKKNVLHLMILSHYSFLHVWVRGGGKRFVLTKNLMQLFKEKCNTNKRDRFSPFCPERLLNTQFIWQTGVV